MNTGAVHTLIVALLTGRWSYSLLIAFTAFGMLTVASRLLAPALKQGFWPLPCNLALNVVLVTASFDLGFRINEVLI